MTGYPTKMGLRVKGSWTGPAQKGSLPLDRIESGCRGQSRKSWRILKRLARRIRKFATALEKASS